MVTAFRRLALLAVALAITGGDLVMAQGHFYYGRNKVQYEDFDWQVLRTEHFEIYYDAAAHELARIGAAEAEETYAVLVHRFGIELPERVPLVFYATNIHFRQTNTIHGSIPQGVAGFFEFLKGRVVIPADGDIHRFRRVIRHELVHVFTYRRLGEVMRDHRRAQPGLPPLWFTEGLAEYWSGDPDHRHEMVMRDAVASNLLIRLEDLSRVGGFLIYKQGESICRFLSETYGEEKLALLIENVWRDSDFRKVMEHVMREPFPTIADRYDEWVRARYYPKIAASTPSSLTGRRISGDGFSAKPLALSNADGSPAVAFIGNRRGHMNLYLAHSDGGLRQSGSTEMLVRGERGPRFEAFHPMESRLDVSEDGRVVFATQSGGSDVLHIYDLHRRELVASHRPVGLVAAYSPTWNPDGDRLAFAGIGRSGFADLYVIDLDSDQLERLTLDEFDVRDPAWSPCGRWIVFASDRGTDGGEGMYNLFVLDVTDRSIVQITSGDRIDGSPRWSPDGSGILFTSAKRQDHGAFTNQDIWLIESWEDDGLERRLTKLASAALDPHWSLDGRLVFTAYERGRFGIYELDADSLIDASAPVTSSSPVQRWSTAWHHPRDIDGGEAERTSRPYRRSYTLDMAHGGVSTNPVWGSAGGATLAFSDLLGDDRVFVTAYITETPGRTLAEGLNLAISRVSLAGRTNVGYGLFRLSGLRYDRTDPDADAGFPVFFEQLTGAFGSLSYPLSHFQRVEVAGSLAWSRKQVGHTASEREALLFDTGISLTHDNALYGPNGPVQGWKGRISAGTSADLRFGNVGNYTLTGDLRHYLRIHRGVTLASWGLARTSQGNEARLWLLGGSWDLRGFPFLGVRGRNQWFTSHELRVTLADAPSAHLPLLEPFGIRNVRGALFVDAARAWNDDYHARENQLLTGRTLGSAGAGLRVNLFGGIVLRFDTGWRFEDGFDWEERRFFRQLFFGYDF